MSQLNNERPRVKLKTLDELFLLGDEHQAQDELAKKSIEPSTIAIDELIPFSNHPFRLYDGERLVDMVESISKNGVLTPIIVRTTESGLFEILSGHNRVNAAKLAGYDEVPIIIKENLSDDEALIYVIESNLFQRSFSDMLHSERASVLAAHHSEMFSQGKRNDILNELKALSNPHGGKENSTSPQYEKKLRSVEKIGNEYGLSKNTVARYLRIHKLTDSLKNMLDDGWLGFIPAVTLSFLSDSEQIFVSKCIELNKFKVNMKKADLLRLYSERNKLDEDNVYLILSGELNRKPRAKYVPYIIKNDTISKFFSPGQKPNEINDIIDKALAMYFRIKQQEHEIIHTDEQEYEMEP